MCCALEVKMANMIDKFDALDLPLPSDDEEEFADY